MDINGPLLFPRYGYRPSASDLKVYGHLCSKTKEMFNTNFHK